MKIGFVGAGKTGNALSRYLDSSQNTISGFYSNTCDHAKQAADNVHSVAFFSLTELIQNSDIIFITTPDKRIRQVWQEIKQLQLDLTGKIFAHCSGCISSGVFADAEELGAKPCAVHPMRAISSKDTDLSGAFFTLDGNGVATAVLKSILEEKGGKCTTIAPEHKTRYHAAASTASNLMVGLAQMAAELLRDCGFEPKDALEILKPLMTGNMENICKKGPVQALTGPVERGDADTVGAHLNALVGDDREIYRLLSRRLVGIAQQKNKERSYESLLEKLEK